MEFRLFIPGDPAPQGSKTSFGKYGMREASKRVKPWREAVTMLVRNSMRLTRFEGFGKHLTDVEMRFRLNRVLADGDLSKLIRSTEDALVDAGLMDDDRYIVNLTAEKRRAGDTPVGAEPGVDIRVRRAS